ncbi:MAG: maleylpyruvate isomerase family mycothiol-dependent enzyme [Actinomycetia bacterium]|nr:maleylpyruvate isomerase family mycothiol-dependent enzyme [Actinomycetes bacterium]
MFAESYVRAQVRIVELIADKDPLVMVPACPEWTAGDVVRHLAGISMDTTNGVFEGFASDEWTDKQVRDRSWMSLDGVIEEWNGTIEEAAATFDNIERLGLPDTLQSALGPIPSSILGPVAIGDILHHEFDLRNAYNDTSGRDLMDIHFAAAGHARSVRGTFSARNLPTIRIESTDSGMGWDIGHEDPVATLAATSFEIMRAIGGRRTRSEMAGMGWEGDPEPFLDALVLPHLAMRGTSLHE